MKKKVFSIMVALSLSVLLTACDENTSSKTNNTTTTTTKATTNTTKNQSFNDAGNKSNSNPKSNSKSNNSNSSLSSGEYWCMGKGDTCKNKTSSPTDLYCYSCDPDNNNIEGDQRSNKSYGNKGKVKDNNYDGKVNGDDWEKAWKDYLNDKYNDYGF